MGRRLHPELIEIQPYNSQNPETMADTVQTFQGPDPELGLTGERPPATSLSGNVNGYQN